MSKIVAHVQDIRSWVVGLGLPLARIAKEAGLHENTLRNVRGDWKPSIETLEKLEALRERGMPARAEKVAA